MFDCLQLSDLRARLHATPGLQTFHVSGGLALCSCVCLQARRMLVQLLRYDPSLTHPGMCRGPVDALPCEWWVVPSCYVCINRVWSSWSCLRHPMWLLQVLCPCVLLLGVYSSVCLALACAGQPGFGAGSGAPSVMLAYCKHLWNSGERREALSR